MGLLIEPSRGESFSRLRLLAELVDDLLLVCVLRREEIRDEGLEEPASDDLSVLRCLAAFTTLWLACPKEFETSVAA